MDAQAEPASEEGAGPIPQNETPLVLMDAYHTVVLTVETYGWFILAGLVLLYLLYTKLKPYLDQRHRDQEDQAYYKKYDSGTVLKRQEAMEQARQRLQEVHDQQAAAAADKQKEREEKKRQERLEDWDRHQQGLGYRSKVKREDEPSPGTSGKKPKPKKPLRDDEYNPLMGAGGSACYRPPRRGGAGGG